MDTLMIKNRKFYLEILSADRISTIWYNMQEFSRQNTVGI